MDVFVFAGGGSGGHLFPAIAVARELKRRDPEVQIVFVGGRKPVEGDILGRETFERRIIQASSTADLRRNPFGFVWRNWAGYRAARDWLRVLRPRAVIGCGGYSSVPAALAASRTSVPLVLLEQNVVPGRATSWLARRAQAVCTSFAETAAQLPRGTRVSLTGNPVRAEIATLAGRTRGQLTPRPTLLVLGGSQGAASVNAGVLSFVAQHAAALRGWRIVHQSGAREEAAVRARYAALSVEAEVATFIVGMSDAYAGAELAISRAGATTLAELACAGLPAVLVPYPGAVRDHQRRNAESYVLSGAATTATDGSPADLVAALLPLLTDPEQRRRMSTRMAERAQRDATRQVVDAVLAASGGVEARRPPE